MSKNYSVSHDLMIQDVPYDGCKFSTAAKFAHSWNQRVGGMNPKYKVRQVDITSSPMHQRVTAFIRLMDEKVHADAKDYLAYLRLPQKGLMVRCPIRMAYKAPLENRINFNWHYHRDFICHCDQCIVERRALEDLKSPHGPDQPMAPELPKPPTNYPGPIGIAVKTQTDCPGPIGIDSSTQTNCPGTDERACTEPECKLYKDRYLKMWFELQELRKDLKKSKETKERRRLDALEFAPDN